MRFRTGGFRPPDLIKGLARIRMRGLVRWNQPDDGYWWYNTCRPFIPIQWCLGYLGKYAPVYRTKCGELRDWIKTVNEERDWRTVNRERLADLDQIAGKMRAYGLWDLGVKDGEQGAEKIPVESIKRPWAQRGMNMLRAYGAIVKELTVARLRMDEAETAVTRGRAEAARRAEMVDPAESARRVAAWKERHKRVVDGKGNGKAAT